MKQVEIIAKQGIAGVTAGKRDQKLGKIFYPKLEIHKHTDSKVMKTTFDEIDAFLKTCASWLLNHKGYNSYKHGLRTFTGNSKIRLEPANQAPVEAEGSTYWYFDRDENGLCVVFDLFDYKEVLNIIDRVHILIRLLFDVRRGRQKGVKEHKTFILQEGALTRDLIKSKPISELHISFNMLGKLLDEGMQAYKITPEGKLEFDNDRTDWP